LTYNLTLRRGKGTPKDAQANSESPSFALWKALITHNLALDSHAQRDKIYYPPPCANALYTGQILLDPQGMCARGGIVRRSAGTRGVRDRHAASFSGSK
jgi:hypothetical protein